MVPSSSSHSFPGARASDGPADNLGCVVLVGLVGGIRLHMS